MTRSRSIVALAAAAGLALAAGGFASTASQAATPTVTEFPGLPVDGYLVLDLGTQDKFQYRPAASSVDTPSEQLITQSRNKKCQVDPTAGPLAELSATGGDVGLNTDGLGVRAKNGGTNCGQVAGDQELSIKLGDDFAEKLISRAEVDVESKFACVLRVEWKLDGQTVGDPEEIPLSDSSDCGPDSGSATTSECRSRRLVTARTKSCSVPPRAPSASRVALKAT